jgi:signal transduction histidine kinase
MNPDPTNNRGSTPTPASQSLTAPIIECAPVPMVEVEGPLHIVCFVNAAFCRLLQKTRAELTGKSFGEIVRNGEACTTLLDRIYETGEFQTHVDVEPSESNPTYWLYAMWPALGTNERPERVVIQMTKSAQLHQDLAAVNAALLISGLRQHELREEADQSKTQVQAEIATRIIAETTLRGVNEQLRSATQVAERANKAKDHLLAALSHELRMPLTPVLLAAASLREDQRLPADVRERLGMIERNVTLEARLVDDLLDLTKISHGKLLLRSEPCDAHFLIRLALEIVEDEAREKEITIESTLQAPLSGLMADPARFQQVAWNLLRNAVKFTPRGGKVSIRTSNGNPTKSGRWLRIEVADTGVGINPADLEQIFLPFEQGGHSGDHRFGGIGLGLAIARAVVLLHGGRISAQSAGLNQGATFVVELPGATETKRAARPAPQPPPTVPAKPRPLRLLLVEDHAATIKALALVLRQEGHQVTTALNVAEALAAAAGATFDLVISDLGLPDGTGSELMETLRASHGLRGIALSGYGREDDMARSSAAGFIKHLVKPVPIAELRRVLAEFDPAET